MAASVVARQRGGRRGYHLLCRSIVVNVETAAPSPTVRPLGLQCRLEHIQCKILRTVLRKITGFSLSTGAYLY